MRRNERVLVALGRDGRRAAGTRHRPHFLSGPGQAGIPAPPPTRGQVGCAPARGERSAGKRERAAHPLWAARRGRPARWRGAPPPLARRRGASRRSTRGDFCPRPVLPGTRPSAPVPVQPSSRQSGHNAARTGPRGLPAVRLRSLARGRRTHPALKTPHENAPRLGGMARLLVYIRIKVKSSRS